MINIAPVKHLHKRRMFSNLDVEQKYVAPSLQLWHTTAPIHLQIPIAFSQAPPEELVDNTRFTLGVGQ